MENLEKEKNEKQNNSKNIYFLTSDNELISLTDIKCVERSTWAKHEKTAYNVYFSDKLYISIIESDYNKLKKYLTIINYD